MSVGGAVMVEGREQREHPRKATELPVIVADDENRVEGEICFDTRDLSVGGAFLRSDLLFEVGEELELAFYLPDDLADDLAEEAAEPRAIRARARVVHVVRDPFPGAEAGMGIAFTNLSERDREAVRSYLAAG